MFDFSFEAIVAFVLMNKKLKEIIIDFEHTLLVLIIEYRTINVNT